MIKKEYFYLLPVVLVMLTQDLYIPFKKGETPEVFLDNLVLITKLLPFVALSYVILNLRVLNRNELLLFLLTLFYFIYLVFESIYLYNSLFEFPHVFLKVANLFMVFATIVLYKMYTLNFEMLMNFLLIGLTLKIMIDPSVIDTAAFVSHERGLNSEAVFILLLPCLYFFNSYITDLKKIALIKFLILIFFIVYFQHRTVWTATFFAFIFNMIIVIRQKNLNLSKVIPGAAVLLILLFFLTSIVLAYLPSVGEKILENINNIANPQEDSTASWRILQFESYWPFVESHFVEGLRLRGFELPIQFYHPEAGTPYFSDNTGHHFHSFYYDKLFYFGIIGIVIFLVIMVPPVKLAFNKSYVFDNIHKSLISFIFGSLVFSISYDLPFYYWVFLGIAISQLRISKLESKN